MRNPQCKAYFTGKDWKLRIPLSTLLCSVTLRFSTGQLERKKGKTTSLCQQHRLTCKQPCKGRKSLSLARKYIQPVSESKIKTSLTTAMQTEDTYKFNQSSVALSMETTHTVYRNEERKARMAASDIHPCMHGRF